ncbi:MAG: hypothetical protein ACRDWX_06890 [Acidimicrobiia bacterium]
MTVVYTKRLEVLARRQQADLRLLEAHIQVTHRKLDETIERLEKAEALAQALREKRKEEMGQLELMREDPVVLVRSYGDPPVYHSPKKTCGWVREPDLYDRLLLGEA